MAVVLERATRLSDDLARTLNLGQKPPKRIRATDFSLQRAMLLALGKIKDKDAPVESIARDMYREMGFTSTAGPYSMFLPPSVLLHHLGTRVLQPYQSTTATAGAELIETTFRPDQFVDALRPRSVVLRLGATAIGGLRGDIQIPRQDTTSVGYWLTPSGSPVESQAITESEATFDSTPLTVTVAPCQVGAYGRASRLWLQQAQLADFVISNDLMKTLGTAFDVAAIAGSGSGGTPTGIVNVTGVNAVSGATFAYSTAVSALSALTESNSVLNRATLGWAVNATSAATLAQRQKVTGYPAYVMEPNCDTGTINGHAALGSTNVPASTAVFGDFSQLLVLSWGSDDQPIEIELSSFGAGFNAGDVQYRAMLTANIAVRHPTSFTVVTGIT
jgi:hypothetical protein